jgi:hypothetical protein
MKSKITKHFSTSLLFPIDIDNLSYGRHFFEIVQKIYPELMPRKYGNIEPLKNDFDGDIEKMLLTCWRDMFIWKSKVRSTEALWNINNIFGEQRIHSGLVIYGNPNKFKIDNIKALYRELIKHNSADIGHIHILAEPELQHYKQYYNEVVSALNVGFNTIPLKRCIGNLAWGMYFGKPYIEMIGLEKLLKTPAFLVEQCNDVVYLQVTENIEDIFHKYEEFERLRTQIKEYLGRQYFFHPDLAKNEYCVPMFNF